MKPCEQCQCAAEMKCHNVSEKQSCELIGIPRSSYRYKPVGREAAAALAAELRQIAMGNRVVGYRVVWACLRWGGMKVNHKQGHRL